jgi:hypothetical protein
VSLTPLNNLSAVSLTPVNSFSAVSTPAKNFRLFGYFPVTRINRRCQQHRNSEFETAPKKYLGAWGTLIDEKNLKSKISCQTPFNTEIYWNANCCVDRQERTLLHIGIRAVLFKEKTLKGPLWILSKAKGGRSSDCLILFWYRHVATPIFRFLEVHKVTQSLNYTIEIFVMYGNAAAAPLKATLHPYLAMMYLTQLCCTLKAVPYPN